MASEWRQLPRRRASKRALPKPKPDDDVAVDPMQVVRDGIKAIETDSQNELASLATLRAQISEIEDQLQPSEVVRHRIRSAQNARVRVAELRRKMATIEAGIRQRCILTKLQPFKTAIAAATRDLSKPTVVRADLGPPRRRKQPKEKRRIRVLNESNPDTTRVDADVVMDEFVQSFHLNTPSIYVFAEDQCVQCGTGQMKTLSEHSMMCCNTCGYTVHYVDTTVRSLGYGQDADFSSFSYRRDNHFREWLQCFQGKESTVIPPDVLDKVCMYLSERDVHPHDVNRTHIRAALKIYKVRRTTPHPSFRHLTFFFSSVPR